MERGFSFGSKGPSGLVLLMFSPRFHCALTKGEVRAADGPVADELHKPSEASLRSVSISHSDFSKRKQFIPILVLLFFIHFIESSHNLKVPSVNGERPAGSLMFLQMQEHL